VAKIVTTTHKDL